MKRLIFLLVIGCSSPPTAIEPVAVDRFDVEVSFTATLGSFNNCDFVIKAVASDPTRAVIYELTVDAKPWDSGNFFGTYESVWQQSQGSSADLAYTFSSGTWSKATSLSASC